MYENNTKVLMEFLKNGKERIPGLMDEFHTAKTEEERVALLRRLFIAEMESYETIPLWVNPDTGKEEIPGWRTEEQYQLQLPPQIAFFPILKETAEELGVPEGGGRGTILVSPGGGYNCICSLSEGTPVIGYFLKKGYSCALLSYRLKPYTQYASVADITRAVRVLRYRAKELAIRPNRIAVHGGSAGGNLSALCAVHYDYGNAQADDPVERQSSRPDTAVIMYGAFTQVGFPGVGGLVRTEDDSVPADSPVAALVSPVGDKRRKDLYYFSPEKYVTPDTPPFFFWQASNQDDPRFVYHFAKELADSGIRTEVHLFPYGPHGIGLCDGSAMGYLDRHAMHWAELAAEWLELIFEGKETLQ